MKKIFINIIPLLILLVSCQSDPREMGAEASVDKVLEDAKKKSKKTVKEEVKPTIPADTINVAKIAFEEKEFDFGTINEGEKIDHVFKFKNTGKVPLVIKEARGSCGCTVPKWPEDPIPVGGSGEIKVAFNSSGKGGPQKKSVTLTANTYPKTTRVYIGGQVTPKNKNATTNQINKNSTIKTAEKPVDLRDKKNQ